MEAMKRPVIAAAVFLAAASALDTQTVLLRNIWPAVWLAVIGIAILLSSFHKKLAWAAPYIALAAASLLYVHGYQRLITQPVTELSKEGILTIRAVVLDFPDIYEDSQRVPLHVIETVKEASEQQTPRAFKTLCYLPLTSEYLEPGDQIETQVSFYQPDIRDGFARQNYYAANGYFVLARCSEAAEVLLEREKPVWWSYPLRLAKLLKQSVSCQLPKRQAGLLNAILFGDKSGMSAADSRNLRKAGLSHVAAVSGMHVGFLAMFFCILLGRKVGSFIAILAVLCFVPMAGASPSVIRAAIMYTLMAISFLRFEESEALNALAVALTVLLLLNPYAISGASLLLSFGATLGLLLFSGRLQNILMQPFVHREKWIRRFAGPVISVVSCSLSVMVFTTPILLVMFGYVTILSPLANLLTLAIVGAAFMLGLLLAACGLFLPVICVPLMIVEEALLTYLLTVSDWVAHLPFGVLSWGDLIGKAAIGSFYIATLFLLLLPIKRHAWFLTLPICLLLSGCSLWVGKNLRETPRLVILPCGAGQTLLYITGPDALTVIDCGGDKAHDSAEAVVAFLDWNGFETVDTLILTAVDQSHARYAPKLLETGLIRSLVFPQIPENRQTELYAELLTAAAKARIPYQEGLPVRAPEGITLMDGVERKLAVSFILGGKQVLTLHSLTQNMISEFLGIQPIKADILLLSEQNIENADLLRSALEKIKPEDLILECGYIDNESLLRRPCHNTKLEGEIILLEQKGGGIKWQ